MHPPSSIHQESEQARVAMEAVARRSYGKLVAFLATRTRDVSSAEDALSDAFATALADWPRKGCPQNPEAWLLTVARRKLSNALRRQRSHEGLEEQFRLVSEAPQSKIPDERLALMFACAHPAIDIHTHAPLILQSVLGLDAAKIASAFLMSPAAMSQRLVRAKSKIKVAGIPFRIPEHEELGARLHAVLDAIYAAFAEGWVDAAGTDVARRDLSEEAIYLCRLVIELLPEEPEALGLLALMLYAEARRPARRDEQGEYVPLADQNASLWNAEMIREAEVVLMHANKQGRIGRYQLEAAIQSAHIYRRRTGCPNWEDVVHLYDALWTIWSSPVVAVNRAVALAELQGPDAALMELEAAASDSRLNQYQPYWAARAQFLARAAKHAEAHHAYEIAIGLERDPAVRHFLQQRQSELNFRPA